MSTYDKINNLLKESDCIKSLETVNGLIEAHFNREDINAKQYMNLSEKLIAKLMSI